jgi:hypothetical protein
MQLKFVTTCVKYAIPLWPFMSASTRPVCSQLKAVCVSNASTLSIVDLRTKLSTSVRINCRFLCFVCFACFLLGFWNVLTLLVAFDAPFVTLHGQTLEKSVSLVTAQLTRRLCA